MTSSEVSAREVLLTAAAEAFAEHGFAGSRVDRIAKTAGVNKQLIYYYFGDKLGLYQAVMEQLIGIVRMSDEARFKSSDLRATILTWLSASLRAKSALWVRLVAREGLDGAATAKRSERTASVRMTIDEFKKVSGHYPAGISPEMMYLIITYLSSGPVVIPQLVSMATGLSADSEEFIEQYMSAVLALVAPDE